MMETALDFAEAPFAIIDGDRGKNYPKEGDFLGSGYCLFLSAANVTKTGFEFSNCMFIDEKKDAALNKGKLQREDIVLTTRGTIGNIAYFNHTVAFENLRINSGMVILRCDQEKMLPAYLYHFLRSPSFSSQVNSLRSGVAQPQLPIRDMRRIKIHVPPLTEQRRVAGILSAYDDLIENNRRRIKILEEMARSLYREWFVHFRYPGHEKVPLVGSTLGLIPKGWEVKTVADSFEMMGGGTPSRKEPRYWDGGTIQWFAPSDLTAAGAMFMDDSSDHITTQGLAKSSSRLFPARSVMLTSRATIGAIAINTHEACTNQGFITCLQNERVPLYFLFHWLTENVPTFQRMASGATFKEISRGVFKTIEFLMPPAILVRRFEDSSGPIAEQLLAFQRQIRNLRNTRDMLLQRLLSGRGDVA